MTHINRGHHFMSGFGTNDYLEDYFIKPSSKFRPSVNITENEDQYKIEMGLPGFSKKDLDIKRIDNELIVSGRKEILSESAQDNNGRKKTNYDTFTQSLVFPNDVLAIGITATHQDGLLIIELPRKRKGIKGRETHKIELS
jgi:HSP20 family protein